MDPTRRWASRMCGAKRDVEQARHGASASFAIRDEACDGGELSWVTEVPVPVYSRNLRSADPVVLTLPAAV